MYSKDIMYFFKFPLLKKILTFALRIASTFKNSLIKMLHLRPLEVIKS